MNKESQSTVLDKKLSRLRTGAKLRALDLFAGCGGFSLGFQRAGCEIIAGLELDPFAAMSHAVNFHGRLRESDPERFELHASPRDITQTDPLEFIRSLGYRQPEEAVDVLVGGPPCPTFARVGRAKLREIHDHPEAFKQDPRSQLYLPYLRFVEKLRPLMLVMENVPDIMNYGGHNLAEEICEVLEDDGYRTAYSLLNAANYGVPEMRERFILIGIHRVVGADPRQAFPRVTHHVRFPPGYQGARDVALKTLRQSEQLAFEQTAPVSRFVETPPQDHLDPEQDGPVTAEEALRDLPVETRHLRGQLKKGRRDLSDASSTPYPNGASKVASVYVRRHMWGWPGFESGPGTDRIRAHVIRSLSNRDYRLFAAMEPGWQYPEAYKLAAHFFAEHVAALHERSIRVPDELPTGRAIEDACRAIADALLESFEPTWEAQLAGAVRAWDGLRDLVERHIRHKRDYKTILEQLRDVSRHPEGSVVALDLMEDWLRIGRALRGLLEANSGDSSLAVDFKGLLACWRLRESYERGFSALAIEQVGIVPLDLARGSRFAELKNRVRFHQKEWESSSMKPLELRCQRVAWCIMRFVQRAGECLNLKHQFVPPYDPGKFPNKWRKMEPDWPARTLMAHLGKDSYSHIHYDSKQARTISVREAARLQSFPDGFRFAGSMNPGFRQIGNAVPPLFAFAMADRLLGVARHASLDERADTSAVVPPFEVPLDSSKRIV